MSDWKKWLRDENTKSYDDSWNFSEFKIQCKCGSYNNEINGEGESEGGYYRGESYFHGDILVKCHDCGNAMRIIIGSYFEMEGINKEND